MLTLAMWWLVGWFGDLRFGMLHLSVRRTFLRGECSLLVGWERFQQFSIFHGNCMDHRIFASACRWPSFCILCRCAKKQENPKTKARDELNRFYIFVGVCRLWSINHDEVNTWKWIASALGCIYWCLCPKINDEVCLKIRILEKRNSP